MTQTKFIIASAATAASILVAIVLTPIHASAQAPCPPGFADRYGCTLQYSPARGERGPGNGPWWQGEPTDHLPIWRHGRYLGNDPDNFIRRQLMRAH
jgi:hypothetical protein